MFLQAYNYPWALQENNALQLANWGMCTCLNQLQTEAKQ